MSVRHFRAVPALFLSSFLLHEIRAASTSCRIRLFEFSDIRTFGSAIKLFFDASGRYLGISDFCGIDAGSVGSNEGTFTPRNFLNVSSWTGGSDSSESDGTKYRFYGYYPQLTAPASTYSKSLGGVLLQIPAAQTGEFGRYQVCSSGMVELRKSEIVKNKMVRFTFSPVSSLLRLRLYLSAQTDASIREAYIKQVILTGSDLDSNLTGGCFLSFVDGTLTSTETAGTRTQITVTLPAPVKITREKDRCGYVDFVMLSTAAGSGRLSFDARLQDNTKLTVAAKDAPEAGFAAGTRYFLDRAVTIVLSDDSDDASYVDGGDAWESKVDNDGSYTDAGFAW